MTSARMAPYDDSVRLVVPDAQNLAGFEAALAAGWPPNPRRAQDETYIRSTLQELRKDRLEFLANLTRSAEPGFINRLFWIWDVEFCGNIVLRFRPGTEELPSSVAGHVGYSVVPWKQGKGYAKSALRLLTDVAREEGLGRLLILCNEENHASRRVIEANGGQLFLTASHPSDRPEQMKHHFWLDVRKSAEAV